MEWTVAIGVDTHRDVHVAVAVDRVGVQLDSREIETTEAGYRSLLSWALGLGAPVFAVEGAGSYGAGLVRFLERAGVVVWECERPRRQERRRGKSDLIDAALAARRAVAGEGLSIPRGGGRREDLRLLLLERRSAVRARTAALNQLSSLLVTAPEQVRDRLRTLSGERLAAAAARLRPDPDVITAVLRRLGRRVARLSEEIAEIERGLAALLAELAPDLLEECGVGPVCGAQLLVSSGDPRRMASEASFAALAGTSPVEASSGQQQRHRLNRGGDRQLNWALHVVALARIHHHEETAAYYERLLAAGKTAREARRCVKRALARYFYRRLRELPTLALTT
ncbi:MAG: IS110 family transposase, partial [Gaiellaceae bacterium]